MVKGVERVKESKGSKSLKGPSDSEHGKINIFMPSSTFSLFYLLDLFDPFELFDPFDSFYSPNLKLLLSESFPYTKFLKNMIQNVLSADNADNFPQGI